MKDQPVANNAIVAFIAMLIGNLATRYVPGLGLTPDQAMWIALGISGVVMGVFAKVTHKQVAPLAKMARIAPDAHASYMAALGKKS